MDRTYAVITLMRSIARMMSTGRHTGDSGTRHDGELQERTVKRKDGPVVVATPYGIRYRQLGQWI
eukprot:COSAG03_NODE_28871_length_193_cov_20.223404_1_plen_64_part_11